MKTSESIKTIAPLLLKAQQTMGDVKKGSENPFFNSSYADLNSIREASIPVLNTLGISVLQPTVVVDGKNYVETLLLHTSGEWVSSQTAIVNDKGTAQAEGSGLSYARRYGLQSLLNIGAVDDDAESATKRGNQPQPVKNDKPRSTFKKANDSITVPNIPSFDTNTGTSQVQNIGSGKGTLTKAASGDDSGAEWEV